MDAGPHKQGTEGASEWHESSRMEGGQDCKGVEGTEARDERTKEGRRWISTVVMLGDGRDRSVESRDPGIDGDEAGGCDDDGEDDDDDDSTRHPMFRSSMVEKSRRTLSSTLLPSSRSTIQLAAC